MPRLTFALAVAAVLAAATAAVLPSEPETAKLSKTFLIEALVPPEFKSPDNRLFAQAIHSGAGENDLMMVPIGDATAFHYNATTGHIYNTMGSTKKVHYLYTLDLADYPPETRRLRAGYKNIQFNLGSVKNGAKFVISSKENSILPKPAPKGFTNFAVCHTNEIADDEPISSYQQLVWQDGSPASGCTIVVLRATNIYGN